MKTDDVLVRAFEPEDLPEVTQLLNQPRAIWGTLQLPYTSIEARRQKHAANAPGHTFLVAVIGGKVVGNAGLHPQDNRRRAHAATIGMAVHDSFAGRGAGTALLSALLDLADNWLNFKRVELTVWTDNERAIELYERAGFEREGTMRAHAWRDGKYADAFAMARLRL